MAKAYVNVKSGSSREYRSISAIYAEVDHTAREVLKAYCNVEGKARLCYSAYRDLVYCGSADLPASFGSMDRCVVVQVGDYLVAVTQDQSVYFIDKDWKTVSARKIHNALYYSYKPMHMDDCFLTAASCGNFAVVMVCGNVYNGNYEKRVLVIDRNLVWHQLRYRCGVQAFGAMAVTDSVIFPYCEFSRVGYPIMYQGFAYDKNWVCRRVDGIKKGKLSKGELSIDNCTPGNGTAQANGFSLAVVTNYGKTGGSRKIRVCSKSGLLPKRIYQQGFAVSPICLCCG